MMTLPLCGNPNYVSITPYASINCPRYLIPVNVRGLIRMEPVQNALLNR